MKHLILILCALFFQNAMAQQQATRPEEMHSYTVNGFELSGAEYWVFVAGHEFVYPDDVLWGFMGEEKNNGEPSNLAPEATRNCALKAYNRLVEFLQNPPADLVELQGRGATPRFFLWTNDYTQAAPEEEERPNKFWHWNRGPKDYTKGYWKWESTLDHSGTCLIPDDTQIAAMLADIKTLFP
jgi:hypothetical protein